VFAAFLRPIFHLEAWSANDCGYYDSAVNAGYCFNKRWGLVGLFLSAGQPYRDDPMIDPQNNQYNSISPQANFGLTMIVPLFDNNGNLIDIENFIVAVFNKLAASNLNIKVGSVSAPSVSPNETGQMLMAEMSLSILSSWS
jgi:hypothetical protein